MKILVLEDTDERIIQFKETLATHDVHFVKTATDAVYFLGNEDWDVVFLDHDLGGETMQPSTWDTGYGVACYLEQMPERKPKHIIIHSFNPVGAMKMRLALPEAHLLPAAWCMSPITIFERIR